MCWAKKKKKIKMPLSSNELPWCSHNIPLYLALKHLHGDRAHYAETLGKPTCLTPSLLTCKQANVQLIRCNASGLKTGFVLRSL